MSIQFYQNHAEEFFQGTVNVDMNNVYQHFLSELKIGDLILDAGCGSGRDSKAFLERGFKVEAFDASSALAEKAKIYTGLDVQVKRFEDISDIEKYDAIWCCASLLHVPEKDLSNTMKKLAQALKNNGIWYVSFKYGSSERKKDGRTFTDLNEERLSHVVSQLDTITVKKAWITKDNRPERDEKWLNAILKK
jgi:2-polyprenyl-3-methyl-5-hydroxy-6-metoxy-1,4-benzoquinol methylase